MEVISFRPLSLYPTGRRLNYRLNRGLGGPKNQSEVFVEDKTLALVRNPTAFSWLSNQLSNPHTDSASQAVYTSLRFLLIIYFYL